MRIGLWLDDGDRTAQELARDAAHAAEAGFHSLWLSERDGWDPLTLLAAVGQAAPDLPVGTSIIRSYPRHPVALAAQALTVQALTGNRLLLGVGPGPAPIIETRYGHPFTEPVANLREYLRVLTPALRGEPVSYRGRHWAAEGAVTVPGAKEPPVLLSALGPAMLRLAGEAADGTMTTWAGPGLVESYFVPALARAAASAGRPAPTVVAGVCVCVTTDPDGARRWIDDAFGAARGLPSYRALFDRQGLDGPADTAIVGDTREVERRLRQFADAGAAEVQVIACGTAADRARTIDALGAVARAW
ncbi:TIGR03564 family F420-dependent LLM class oxidoreductase [Frankia sp. CNm7]|uniref:TIGR03564 family F420-dependent LLM class oxidoreductase n=1 Tax=Frankia nepalensis TaxID=1836974 RepID=A0A937RPK1_9ACTN|nr:TIGR03564 family F420-dependent LLM class oxidoreductase [Frankia nepalensis]MBL7495103.1 TIGR03564 family F420-dependent LLM class oxidoreductase [Frankia nepalensis]MBL7515396.1 TIGR03564 family F420-dependent LLM class oxidoreductase [Frankia nepalensis]MBL7518850.1 TIGR03564 family F420-dependent LLM class oxidoreductase [Frankia nepalensis]MBL7632569.1 TIGR03564 family F420-dependent LLM class oxidoreductase [Frankia nepalensis]